MVCFAVFEVISAVFSFFSVITRFPSKNGSKTAKMEMLPERDAHALRTHARYDFSYIDSKGIEIFEVHFVRSPKPVTCSRIVGTGN